MGNWFGGGKKPPPPTDPTKVIAAQDASNAKSAQQQDEYNRGNPQENAYGTQFSRIQVGTNSDGTPIYSYSTTWGQPTRDFYSGLNALGGQYNNLALQKLQNPADLSSMPAFQQAEEFATANLGRQFQLRRDALENQLKNQGIYPGTPAYDNEMRSLTAGFGDAYNNAVNPLQQQFFNQNVAARNQGINELTQLANPGIQAGFQGMNAGFTPIPGINIGTTNAAQAYQNYDQMQLEAWKQQQQQQSDMLGGIGKLALGIGMAPMTGGTSLFGSGLNWLGSKFS